MRKTIAFCVIPALFAAFGFGQTAVQSVLQFAQTESVQDFQEIANAIRVMAEVSQASADNAKKTLSLTGTGEQIALAEWIFKQLDQTAPPQNPDPSYTAGPDDVVRIFYLTKIGTVQEFQEIANATRSMASIRRAFTVNAQRAVVVRGSADQMALASWLVQGMSRQGEAVSPEYKAGADDVVQMFHLPHAASVQDFQEVANLVRTITTIRQAFTVNGQLVLTVRGTAAQMAMAAWLVNEFDQTAAAGVAGPHEYRAGVDDLVRVYYLKGAATNQDFQKAANDIRTASGIRQAFTETSMKALAVRGTAEEMQICENTIKKLGL